MEEADPVALPRTMRSNEVDSIVYCVADAERARHVVESEIVIVVIDGIHLLVNVGHEQVLPAVLIVVGGVHTHAGSRASILAVGDTRVEPDFFESASAIEEKKIRHSVIGHEQVHPAIVVNVGSDHAPRFTRAFAIPASADASRNVPSPLL